MRRHLEAAEVVLAQVDAPNAVVAETLRGLARAWDVIELKPGESLGILPNLANQILRTLEVLGINPAAGDWVDELVAEIAKK